MIGDVLGLILSIIVAGAMIWGCSFDTQEIVIGPLAQFSAGKYQFLTIINLVRIFVLARIKTYL